MNKDKMMERDLFGIFLVILLYNGKETYERRMLPKRIVIIGRISRNNKTNANINSIKGTILW